MMQPESLPLLQGAAENLPTDGVGISRVMSHKGGNVHSGAGKCCMSRAEKDLLFHQNAAKRCCTSLPMLL